MRLPGAGQRVCGAGHRAAPQARQGRRRRAGGCLQAGPDRAVLPADLRGARDRRAQALAAAAALARPPGVLRQDLPGGRGLGLRPGCSTLIGQQPGRSAQRARSLSRTKSLVIARRQSAPCRWSAGRSGCARSGRHRSIPRSRSLRATRRQPPRNTDIQYWELELTLVWGGITGRGAEVLSPDVELQAIARRVPRRRPPSGRSR
jgi:hypothetical protein